MQSSARCVLICSGLLLKHYLYKEYKEKERGSENENENEKEKWKKEEEEEEEGDVCKNWALETENLYGKTNPTFLLLLSAPRFTFSLTGYKISRAGKSLERERLQV